jgi:phage shock protein PspC (stress-responsive transcriptional regulator)
MLGGVAAGIAATYGFDVVLVRVLWVIAAFIGIGVPAYVVAWIAIPADDGTGGGPVPARSREVSLAIGLGLVALGVTIAFGRAWPVGRHLGSIAWPLFLVAGGLAVLLLRNDQHEIAPEAAPVPPAPAPPAPAGATTTGHETAATTATVPAPPAPPVPPTPGWSTPPGAPAPTTAWTQTAPWPTAPTRPPRPPRPRGPRPFLTPLTIGVLLIGGGIVALLDALDVIDVDPTYVFAGALAVVAAVLVLSAWVGRAHGLIAVGLLLSFAAIVSSIVDVPLHGGWGDRAYAPTTAAAVQEQYELAGGSLELDLRAAPLAGRTTAIDVTVGFGQLEVFVPRSVRVIVHAHAGAGEITIFGFADQGLDVDTTRIEPGTGSGTLRLDLRVGAGEIRVQHAVEVRGTETFSSARAA